MDSGDLIFLSASEIGYQSPALEGILWNRSLTELPSAMIEVLWHFLASGNGELGRDRVSMDTMTLFGPGLMFDGGVLIGI